MNKQRGNAILGLVVLIVLIYGIYWAWTTFTAFLADSFFPIVEKTYLMIPLVITIISIINAKFFLSESKFSNFSTALVIIPPGIELLSDAEISEINRLSDQREEATREYDEIQYRKSELPAAHYNIHGRYDHRRKGASEHEEIDLEIEEVEKRLRIVNDKIQRLESAPINRLDTWKSEAVFFGQLRAIQVGGTLGSFAILVVYLIPHLYFQLPGVVCILLAVILFISIFCITERWYRIKMAEKSTAALDDLRLRSHSETSVHVSSNEATFAVSNREGARSI